MFWYKIGINLKSMPIFYVTKSVFMRLICVTNPIIYEFF